MSKRYSKTSRNRLVVRAGKELFRLDNNLMTQLTRGTSRAFQGSYFLVRGELQRVLSAKNSGDPISVFYNGDADVSTFHVHFDGSGQAATIREIGCMRFNESEGRKLARWATYQN